MTGYLWSLKWVPGDGFGAGGFYVMGGRRVKLRQRQHLVAHGERSCEKIVL